MARPQRQLNVEVLQQLVATSGLEYNDKNARSWVFDCPQCGKSEKLYVRRRDGRTRCWSCGPDGPLEGAPEYALALLLSRPLRDVQAKLYGEDFQAEQRLDVVLTYSAARTQEPRAHPGGRHDDDDEEQFIALPPEVVAPKGLAYPLEFLALDDPRAHRGRGYLEAGRGVPLELALEYGLRYDPIHRRVVIPVVTRGVLVGWQARTIGKSEWVDADTGVLRKIPKILTTMVEGQRDNVVMFEHRLEGSGHAVLAEGPFDALKCHLCGGNVCTMGSAVTPGQVARLQAFGVRRLYLAQDPDAAEETERLARTYYEDFEVFYMTPEGTGFEDFGAMPPEVALECFRAAERVHPRRLYVYLDPGASIRF